jgi:hypothetical protein
MMDFGCQASVIGQKRGVSAQKRMAAMQMQPIRALGTGPDTSWPSK